MRIGQGLPVNMIVLTALALLVLVVVGAFFISGFGEASSSVNVVDSDQADCQAVCQSLAASAFNYKSCGDLYTYDAVSSTGAPKAINYLEADIGGGNTCADNFGACTVTIGGGDSCTCGGSLALGTQLCN